MLCPRCNSSSPETARFCDDCGCSLDAPVANASSQTGRGPLVYALAALVAMAVVLAAMALWLGGGLRSSDRTGVTVSAVEGDYALVSELWDGRDLTRRVALLHQERLEPGRYETELLSASLQGKGSPLSFSLADVEASVTTRLDPQQPTDHPSVQGALASELIRQLEGGGLSQEQLELQVRVGDGLSSFGSLPVRLVASQVELSGRRWHRVTLHSQTVDLISPHGGGIAETRVRGLFVWDLEGRDLAVAELWVSRRHGDILAWSRLVLQATDPAFDVGEFYQPGGYLPPVIPPPGRPLSVSASAELEALNRSAFLVGSAQAEQAANPVLLTALAAIHLADSAWTLGANLVHDLEQQANGSQQPIDPFDGDVESPLERYVYRNVALGGASLAARLGIVEPQQVEVYAYYGGKVLHVAGGVVLGLASGVTASSAVTQGTSHAAHVIWGHSAHLAAGAQHALVALGRVAYYGGQSLGGALELADATIVAHQLAVDFEGLQSASSAPDQRTREHEGAAQAPSPRSVASTERLVTDPLAVLSDVGLGDYRDLPMVLRRPDAVTARVVIVLDRSGSMGQGGSAVLPIEHARRAVRLVASVLRPEDELAVVAFESTARTVRGLEPVGVSHAVLEASLRGLRPDGGTNFGAALAAALEVAKGSDGPAPLVLFVSDGKSDTKGLDSLLTELRNLGVGLHAIPVGKEADLEVLCGLADALDGWCVPVTDAGLEETLIQLLDSTRGMRTLAQVRDVIRPGELQPVVIELPSGVVAGAAGIQLTGSWTGSDLAFSARSPSGREYSTDEPGEQGYTTGGAASAFRVLKVPFEAGRWVFEAEGRDVPSSGEAYAMTISADSTSALRLETLSDRFGPGERVSVALEGCGGGRAELFGPAGAMVEVPLHVASDDRCVAELEAPVEVGFYPLALHATDGAGVGLTTWATVAVGASEQVVSARERWRAAEPVWSRAPTESSGAALLVVLVLSVGALVVLVRTREQSAQTALSGAQPAAGSASREQPGMRIHPPGVEPTWVPLGDGAVRIGRSPDNDVVVDVAEVSRWHLVIEPGAGSWVVRNLGRAESTLLDGQPCPPGSPLPLSRGATLRLAGGVLMWLE